MAETSSRTLVCSVLYAELAGHAHEPVAGQLRLRLGLNLGTVHVVQDLRGQTTIVGDGVNEARRVARVISPIQRVGDKWMASCDHPQVRLSECKVEKLGLTSIVTGPTREAVAAKVAELVERGSRLTGEIEQDGGMWTAVCDAGGAGG